MQLLKFDINLPVNGKLSARGSLLEGAVEGAGAKDRASAEGQDLGQEWGADGVRKESKGQPAARPSETSVHTGPACVCRHPSSGSIPQPPVQCPLPG